MSVLYKCKNCGGDVAPCSDGLTGECRYCGSVQTLPKEKDEKLQNLLNRANDFRMSNDFDRAIYTYEEALEIDNREPEAHWGIFLSRYGVEYVRDPQTYEYKPTIHRITSGSVYDDPDYQSTLKYASEFNKEKYKSDAAVIEGLMKELLTLSANQDSCDIFLSYKEADDSTRLRTEDSYLAHSLYAELTAKGYKVFFAPKSLGAGLFEPKIYSAIISSKVMIVLGTKEEYFNAVWVKNEWSRFSELVESGEDKVIIPVYKIMNADSLPNRLAKYQALDMSDMSFLTKLTDMLSEFIDSKKSFVSYSSSDADIAYVERGFLSLEDGDFLKADSYFENALNQNPHNAQAYFGKLMAEMRITDSKLIVTSEKPLKEYKNFEKAVRFADAKTKTVLLKYEETVNEALNQKKYSQCKKQIESASGEADYISAIRSLSLMKGYRDSDELIKLCESEIASIKLEHAQKLMNNERSVSSFSNAISIIKGIKNYQENQKAVELINVCENGIAYIKSENEKHTEEEKIKAEKERKIQEENHRKQKKKGIIKRCLAFVLALVITVSLVNGVPVFIANIRTDRIVSYMENGKYGKALKKARKTDDRHIIAAADKLIDSGHLKESVYVLDCCEEYPEEKIFEIEKNMLKRASEGDTVCYGSTFVHKDGDKMVFESSPRTDSTRIGWIVLRKENDKILLISERILAMNKFSENDGKASWGNSFIRKFLNDELYEIFNNEKMPVVTTTHETSGKNVDDKLFLLSEKETTAYFSSDSDKKIATDAAFITNEIKTSWWLRTIDKNGNPKAVGGGGKIYTEYTDRCGVRPAMWVSIKDSK